MKNNEKNNRLLDDPIINKVFEFIKNAPSSLWRHDLMAGLSDLSKEEVDGALKSLEKAELIRKDVLFTQFEIFSYEAIETEG